MSEGPEHKPVEAIRDVVVVRDRGRVALLRVAPAAEPGLLRRGRERPQAEGRDDPGRGEPLPRRQPDGREPLVEAERLVDVALEIELAGNVRAREAQLAGRGQQAAERVRGAKDHARRRVRGPNDVSVVELDGHRRVRAEQLRDQRGERHGSSGAAGGSSSASRRRSGSRESTPSRRPSSVTARRSSPCSTMRWSAWSSGVSGPTVVTSGS